MRNQFFLHCSLKTLLSEWQFQKFLGDVEDLYDKTAQSLESEGKLPEDFQEKANSLDSAYVKVFKFFIDLNVDDETQQKAIECASVTIRGFIEQAVLGNIQMLTDSFELSGKNPDDVEGYSLAGKVGRMVRENKKFMKKIERQIIPETLKKGFGGKIWKETANYLLISRVNWESKDDQSICHLALGRYESDKEEWGPIREVDIPIDLSQLGV